MRMYFGGRESLNKRIDVPWTRDKLKKVSKYGKGIYKRVHERLSIFEDQQLCKQFVKIYSCKKYHDVFFVDISIFYIQQIRSLQFFLKSNASKFCNLIVFLGYNFFVIQNLPVTVKKNTRKNFKLYTNAFIKEIVPSWKSMWIPNLSSR